MKEQWRPVSGYPGYQVSDRGRVRSVDRTVLRNHFDRYSGRMLRVRYRYKGRLLRPAPGTSGHLSVLLGRGNNVAVHTLVLTAFVGPRPEGREALHGDNGVHDNSLDNLRWGTRSENILDDIRRGVRDQQYGWA